MATPMLMTVALRFLPPGVKLYGLASYALTARASKAYASLRAMPKLGRMPCLANNQVRLLITGHRLGL